MFNVIVKIDSLCNQDANGIYRIEIESGVLEFQDLVNFFDVDDSEVSILKMTEDFIEDYQVVYFDNRNDYVMFFA